jgi:hypothetical protein
VWERGWGGGGKSDEDVYEVIIMDDSLRKLLPDLVILIEIEGIKWLETATCERGNPPRKSKKILSRIARATSICVRENLHLHFLIFVCVCACNRESTSHTSLRVDVRLE